ncbi:hypothetical protein LSUE1_G008463 [Lachnellula suecica]|uniref:DUF7892 domain-containing protein n=1 Tax=Lachnellula suecica TaxID=602035 RepID=A0A8T9C2L5_9HELO|nr:hypothetical protein LSUE1_G008463 [Lachnellula suecica]
MESSGSELSSDSSDASVADSAPANSHPAQTPAGAGSAVPGKMEPTTVFDDDSDSDVSMSADTDEEDEQDDNPSPVPLNAEQAAPAPAIDPAPEASKKRKYSNSTQETPNGHHSNGVIGDIRKRLKPDEASQGFRNPEGHLPQDRSLLPAKIWHQIFTFCPPKALSSLLQVNKSFNAYLNPSSERNSVEFLSGSIAKVLQPDTIWRASRLHFRHGMPGPLSGKSELDMWKLACGSSCQFCNKKQPGPAIPGDLWHPGPGENGNVPIWSFGIRTCGSCLEQKSTKEIDLLLSSSIPSPLMAALPFVFLTNELHVLPPSTLQSGHHPPTIQITKRFYNSQIEEIKKEFDNVKALGSATAEEWLKGLDERGKEKRNDAARWERWDLVGGVANMRKVYHETPKPEGQNGGVLSIKAKTGSPAINGINPVFPFQPPSLVQQSRQYPGFQAPQSTQPIHTIFPTNPPARFDSPAQNGFAAYPPPRSYPQLRHERTKEEVAQLKAARRAEIERRCMLLEPPLTAGVLAHMSSFQAAIQIIQPLNDGAWEVLKPRLLSQREEAEQRENDRLAQTRVVQERFDERRYQDVMIKPEAKDLVDREWDDIQAPLRARIGGYSDEIIRDGWNGGDKVNYENSPKFAADVLIYVRKRFYAEIAKDEAAVRATGREPEMDPPNGPYLRRLVLENMKWVFDTKVKPHTEQHRKELFLCNSCESNPKFYGFEGVIQHYAAKHTSALSMGSIVVHWKSEWPEFPPFNPDPMAVINGSYYSAAPSASVPYASSGPVSQQNYGYGGYQPASVSVPMQAPIQHSIQPMPVSNPHVYQESPGPYFGHPQFGDQYSGHQNGPYPPPQPYQDPSQGYQNPPYSMAPQPNNSMGYADTPHDYSQGYGGAYPPSSQGMYSSNQGPYPTSAPELPVHQQAYDLQSNQYGPSYNQQSSYPTNGFVPKPPRTEEYKAQLKVIAKRAYEVWTTINPVKEIPQSIKVYTIIYHFLQRSRATFPEDPSLEMVIDGLGHDKEMRAARNINGLLCKACALGLAGALPASQKKHMSFPQLLTHFKKLHGNSSQGVDYIPDWTRDIIELPSISKLTSLIKSSDQRVNLVKEALPEIFEPPAPLEREVQNEPRRDFELADQSLHGELAPSQDNHDKYYTISGGNRSSTSGNAPHDSGEYDPRNPQELPLETLPSYKSARRISYSREYDVPDDRTYRYPRTDDDHRQPLYQDRPGRAYVDHRPVSPPSQIRPSGDYERVVIRDEAPVYVDRRPRYRDVGGEIEYRVRRDPPPLRYDDRKPASSGGVYQLVNSESYQSGREEYQPHVARETDIREGRSYPQEDAAAQQNRIFEVVAQISQQAQQARERLPPKEEHTEIGSEDGEVRADTGLQPETRHVRQAEEPNDAAERFLNLFTPGDPTEAVNNPERRQGDDSRPKWEPERNEPARQALQNVTDIRRRVRDDYDEVDGEFGREGRPTNRVVDDAGYVVLQRQPPRQARTYAYEDEYVKAIPEQPVPLERSPELVDRRYKLNNVVYREERQSSHGAYRTPSRYARYESVRLENDRARSRSPKYVKMGGQHGQYREHSPVAHPLQQEPIYRSRTPQQGGEEVTYERAPRQEYQRVYVDEPRSREPQYAEAYELVRVTDARGDYMIRRPVRREPEPVYATYEDETYARQPVYETRAAAPRSEPAPYEEEYDPRHPQALQPPPTQVHQASRYQ